MKKNEFDEQTSSQKGLRVMMTQMNMSRLESLIPKNRLKLKISKGLTRSTSTLLMKWKGSIPKMLRKLESLLKTNIKSKKMIPKLRKFSTALFSLEVMLQE